MTTSIDWHAAALHDLEHTSMTLGEVAQKYGRTERTVAKLVHQSKIIRLRPPTRRGPKRRDNSLPISNIHHAIGIRLNMARGGTGLKTFADRLGVSSQILLRMEVGQFDFKFSQLLKISEITQKSIPELMMSFENNLYQGRVNARH